MDFTTRSVRLMHGLFLATLTLSLAACGGDQAGTDTTSLGGSIAIDGSSTVFPITEAMAEEFQAVNPDVQVTVGVSGTGGGFKKFCNEETDISNASRPIKQSEIDLCGQNGVEFVELPVAFDAVSVVVNPNNEWASCLKVDELQAIWRPEAQGQVASWQQVREGFPAQRLGLYAPGVDSGTFDYFTDAVVGEEGASRGDFTASEDDNILVQGVSNDTGGLGYFGLAYLEENRSRIKAVAIDDDDPSNGDGCIEPSAETVSDGTYQPLARPIFIYVSTEAVQRPEVKAFVEYYLSQGSRPFISEVGYVPLTDSVYEKASLRFSEQKTGSVFTGGSTVGVKLEDLL